MLLAALELCVAAIKSIEFSAKCLEISINIYIHIFEDPMYVRPCNMTFIETLVHISAANRALPGNFPH